ncbi:hypothetical protein SOVF_215830, partial [Spinacia oleracea]
APTQVVIPFHPLLEQITTCLHFPAPVYHFLDMAKNNVYVTVKTNSGPIAYVYVGGEAAEVADSCEKAAQKAVRDLMKKFKVFVEDVTSRRSEVFARCAGLYRLKRNELEAVEKGAPKQPMPEELCEDVDGPVKFVSVDFMSVLRAVFRKVPIFSTPIETLEHTPTQYTSWFTLKTQRACFGFECIVSECCPTLAAAKQSLAKKALDYLMVACNFEVVDANYNPTESKFDALLCALERETCLTVKERVLGIKEDMEPSLLLVEQDCLTPRGALFQITTIASPPLPVKKRKSPASLRPSVVAASSSDVPLSFADLPDLDTVFKRTKFP